ncbi:MAG: class I SAM-dependent methyltransferase [Caulobacteraceae bacterium]
MRKLTPLALALLMAGAALPAVVPPALAAPPGTTKDLKPPPVDADFAPHADATLHDVLESPLRPAKDSARDRYRHPYESLQFWGLRPGLTVIDLEPWGGYWTEILAPYAAKTAGVYIAGISDLADPKTSNRQRKNTAAFEAKYVDPRYGHIRYVGFGAASGPLGAPDSVDIVLTSREIHNWIGDGHLDKSLADIFAVLKPGGVLAVEDHRADPRPQKPDASDGYVAIKTVVDAAAKAGFLLDASSDINANPKDTKDYPFGVWTLPPARQSAPPGSPPNLAFDHTKYDAIGESDRMTLRFRKPG